MATPAPKAPEIERELEHRCQEAFGRGRIASIRADVCVCCGKSATQFRNEVSVKEFTLSGFCQDCQDVTFGVEE